MTKTIYKSICVILLVYIAYVHYLLNGYVNINTKLTNTVNLLIRTCNLNTVCNDEKDAYK